MTNNTTPKPNLKNIRLWIDELRKTRRKQGTKTLKNTDNGYPAYCCLGIACEVARKQGVKVKTRPGLAGCFYYDEEDRTLPKKVQRWLGTSYNPTLPVPKLGHGVYFLSELNDKRGFTFRQIADVLESFYFPTKGKKGKGKGKSSAKCRLKITAMKTTSPS